jgi:hypothetical protein
VDDQEDVFERVRREPDPVRQARLAGELISLYQQRSVELARLRREAINRAAEQKGISFSAIAAELGSPGAGSARSGRPPHRPSVRYSASAR